MNSIDNLSPEELYGLAEELSRINVFGPWTKDGEDRFFRPEPGRRPESSRLYVWHCDGESDLEAGWYWRVGFGVVGIPGCTGTTAYERAEDCMEDADKYVASDPINRLVGDHKLKADSPEAA